MEITAVKRFVGKMMRCHRLHRSMIERYTKEAQLHRSQHEMLLYLIKRQTPPSQKEIASDFEVSAAAIAMSLKKLEQKGLIERIVNENDNRVNLITISELGREVMEHSRKLYESTDAAMLEGVTEEELNVISGVLDKFIDNLIRIGAQDEVPVFCKASKSGKDSN